MSSRDNKITVLAIVPEKSLSDAERYASFALNEMIDEGYNRCVNAYRLEDLIDVDIFTILNADEANRDSVKLMVEIDKEKILSDKCVFNFIYDYLKRYVDYHTEEIPYCKKEINKLHLLGMDIDNSYKINGTLTAVVKNKLNFSSVKVKAYARAKNAGTIFIPGLIHSSSKGVDNRTVKFLNDISLLKDTFDAYLVGSDFFVNIPSLSDFLLYKYTDVNYYAVTLELEG